MARLEKSGESPQALPSDKLDDVMLAMDVVDTLRHEHFMVEKDLAVEDRRQNLVARLRNIYDAQGIEVPDSVLLDGVMALEEHRFAYRAPKPGPGLTLAKLYIGRKKWLPLIYTFGFIFGSAGLIHYVGFVRPAAKNEAQLERLATVEIPQALETARDRALLIAATPELKLRAQAIYDKGVDLLRQEDVTGAEIVATELGEFATDLGYSYSVEVVSRPNAYSGVFRLNDDLGAEDVRNYYLIVEAVDPTGERLNVKISSEEDRYTKRVKEWGVRVPESVFNKIAADKQDDRIIQNAVIGQKSRGKLEPDYSVDTLGGNILDW